MEIIRTKYQLLNLPTKSYCPLECTIHSTCNYYERPGRKIGNASHNAKVSGRVASHNSQWQCYCQSNQEYEQAQGKEEQYPRHHGWRPQMPQEYLLPNNNLPNKFCTLLALNLLLHPGL
jgi:hypothetical protein